VLGSKPFQSRSAQTLSNWSGQPEHLCAFELLDFTWHHKLKTDNCSINDMHVVSRKRTFNTHLYVHNGCSLPADNMLVSNVSRCTLLNLRKVMHNCSSTIRKTLNSVIIATAVHFGLVCAGALHADSAMSAGAPCCTPEGGHRPAAALPEMRAAVADCHGRCH